MPAESSSSIGRRFWCANGTVVISAVVMNYLRAASKDESSMERGGQLGEAYPRIGDAPLEIDLRPQYETHQRKAAHGALRAGIERIIVQIAGQLRGEPLCDEVTMRADEAARRGPEGILADPQMQRHRRPALLRLRNVRRQDVSEARTHQRFRAAGVLQMIGNGKQVLEQVAVEQWTAILN